MFKRGFSPVRIAKERGLAESTIYRHLRIFIENGEMDINRLLPPHKQAAIESILDRCTHSSLKEVKEKLGNRYSYDEIKLVIAHRKSFISKK